MKRGIKILCLLFLTLLIPASVSAEVYQGTCGENVNWYFDYDNYTLTISGTGAVDDYQYSRSENDPNSPWADYGKIIKSVIVEEGVTSLGDCCFGRGFDTYAIRKIGIFCIKSMYIFGAKYAYFFIKHGVEDLLACVFVSV